MTDSNFRFEQDPFGVYQFNTSCGKNIKRSGSSFLSILGIIIAIFGIVVVLILRKTIWKLISNKEYPFLNDTSINETETIE
jgi:hypothetical protein